MYRFSDHKHPFHAFLYHFVNNFKKSKYSNCIDTEIRDYVFDLKAGQGIHIEGSFLHTFVSRTPCWKVIISGRGKKAPVRMGNETVFGFYVAFHQRKLHHVNIDHIDDSNNNSNSNANADCICEIEEPTRDNYNDIVKDVLLKCGGSLLEHFYEVADQLTKPKNIKDQYYVKVLVIRASQMAILYLLGNNYKNIDKHKFENFWSLQLHQTHFNEQKLPTLIKRLNKNWEVIGHNQHAIDFFKQYYCYKEFVDGFLKPLGVWKYIERHIDDSNIIGYWKQMKKYDLILEKDHLLEWGLKQMKDLNVIQHLPDLVTFWKPFKQFALPFAADLLN